jgi:hypothetical protein
MLIGNIEAEKISSDELSFQEEQEALEQLLKQKEAELALQIEYRKKEIVDKTKERIIKGGILHVTPEMKELGLESELRQFALEYSLRLQMYQALGYFEPA